MKNLFLALALTTASFSAFATSDAIVSAYILVKDYNSEEYFVASAPVVGCFGVPRGPQLTQLTNSYMAPSNIGCGGKATKEEINALTCAKVIDSVEADDYSTFKEITLNISKCADKTNVDFINGVKKVVKMNFATPTVKNPLLKIIK